MSDYESQYHWPEGTQPVAVDRSGNVAASPESPPAVPESATGNELSPTRSRPRGAPQNASQANTDPSFRASPSNVDAEMGLLASCLLENGLDVLTDCMAEGMRPEFFYRPAHQVIFEGLLALNATGIPPDELLLSNHLRDKGVLDAAGGHAYLYELTNRIETTVHAAHWRAIVKKKFILRQLIHTAQWTVEQCHNESHGDVADLLNVVEAAFFKISETKGENTSAFIRDTIDRTGALINNLLARRGALMGLPTGFTDLDRILFGLQAPDLIIIGSRPSLGKSSIALNIAENIVAPPPRDTRSPLPVLFFSMEMATDQLNLRLVCSRARVDMQRLKDGYCDRQSEIIAELKALKSAPLIIDEQASLNVFEMRSRARRIKKKHGLGLIIVDYLQLMDAIGNHKSREQEVSEVARGLKAMAKELHLPVIALCQLNRESEREKRPPRLSDLRESGQIEAEADVVLLLGKDRNANPEDEFNESLAVKRELIIAKNRHGPTGEIFLTFNRRLARYENYIGHAC